MDSAASGTHRHRAAQFSLRSLFELTSLCCLLAAMSSILGVWPAAALMLVALALQCRLGGISVLALAAAMLATPLPAGTLEGAVFSRQVAVALAAGAICSWYWLRHSTAAELAPGVPATEPLTAGQRTREAFPFGSPPYHEWR
jgi:hypothetical protein